MVNALESIDPDAAEAMVDAARIGIINEIQRGRSVEEAVDVVQARERAQFMPLGASGESIFALRFEAIQIGRQQVLDAIRRVSYMQQSSLRSGREAWYAGPAEDAENWHGLSQRLATQGRSKEELLLVCWALMTNLARTEIGCLSRATIGIASRMRFPDSRPSGVE